MRPVKNLSLARTHYLEVLRFSTIPCFCKTDNAFTTFEISRFKDLAILQFFLPASRARFKLSNMVELRFG